MKSNLIFKSVGYKNFLATGNTVVTIPLNDKPTTLIYGKNGAGKSTVYEALYFGLYGKAFRKSNIPDLINNVNNKHMLVEVEFSVNGQEFKVRRGRKPTVFEIYKNGKMLDQGSSSYDYQAQLERNILKMSPDTFMQTVILGSLHYVPFMRIRKTKDRMAIIEELLDIQIFSRMNRCTRDRINSINRGLIEMQQKNELLTNSIDLLSAHIKEMEEKTGEQKQKIRDEISELNSERATLESEIEKLRNERDGIDTSAKAQYIKDQERWNRMSTLARKEIQDVERDRKFFSESDSCDRCNQDIAPEFKEKEIQRLELHHAKVEKAIKTKIEPGLKSALDGLEHIRVLSNKLVELNSQIVELNSQIDSTNYQVQKLTRSLEEHEDTSHISKKRIELGKFKGQQTKLLKKKVALQKEADQYDIILKLLQDDGIKRNIIKMYIPIINKLISKYLSILGFPIKFTFDESFKEHIIVKGRRNLTYSSFSAGEKMRVDLALLFAFREIPIIRSGNSCNLLIFDEVADSAMDSDGWDQFLTIINSISDVGNVFVISPRGDQLVEKFSKSLVFSKKGPFSTLDTQA